MPAKTPLHIRGMYGLGDNLHQRAIIRILKQTHVITLETMWASVYHDFLAEGDFRVVRKYGALRTQMKNSAREAHLFAPAPQNGAQGLRTCYTRTSIEHCTESKTILESMFDSVGIKGRYAEADIRLPIPQAWLDSADALASTWRTGGKPVMIYRPLTERPEWQGGALRNADPAAYSEMASMLRDRYFVVSVADLEPGHEWIVGPPFPADVCYHGGELTFELLAAVFSRADLIFTSSGFASVLGPAVSTPTVSIQGGYEPASWHADGAKWAPYLAVEPIRPCRCGTSGCRQPCDKRIDIPAAKRAIESFLTGPDTCVTTVFNQSERATPMLELPDVTLVCVETQMHEMSRIAINDAVSKVKFGGVLIYTDKPELIEVPGATYTVVPNWPDKLKMGAFYYTEAANPIATSHALLMEWDAGVRDVEAWEDGFLEYDYIGAPWPGQPHGGWDPTGGFTVGNGGFALISKRLANYVFEHRARLSGINTDIGLCRQYRGEFESGALKAKWAPEEVAYRFAFECGPPEQAVRSSFGYHDIFNWHLALPNEETIRRTRLLMQNTYIVKGTPKLNLLARSAPWIRTAIPEFDAVERSYGKQVPMARHLTGRQTIRMIQPGLGVVDRSLVPRDPNEQRQRYEAEMQRRGLKA